MNWAFLINSTLLNKIKVAEKHVLHAEIQAYYERSSENQQV
jgi:hypothetical protein